MTTAEKTETMTWNGTYRWPLGWGACAVDVSRWLQQQGHVAHWLPEDHEGPARITIDGPVDPVIVYPGDTVVMGDAITVDRSQQEREVAMRERIEAVRWLHRGMEPDDIDPDDGARPVCSECSEYSPCRTLEIITAPVPAEQPEMTKPTMNAAMTWHHGPASRPSAGPTRAHEIVQWCRANGGEARYVPAFRPGVDTSGYLWPTIVITGPDGDVVMHPGDTAVTGDDWFDVGVPGTYSGEVYARRSLREFSVRPGSREVTG